MDSASLSFYSKYPHEFGEIPEWLRLLSLRILRSGDRVFEAGCGSGSLALFLAHQGCRVLATDATEIRFTQEVGSGALEFQKAIFPLNNADSLLSSQIHYQLLFCIDMLMHVSEHQVLLILHQFQRMLAIGGTLVISTQRGIPNLNRQSRDAHGVLYCQREADQYALLLDRLGFDIKEKSTEEVDPEGQPGLVRDTVVAVLHSRQEP